MNQLTGFAQLFSHYLPGSSTLKGLAVGEKLFRRGDPVNAVFAIHQGQCTLVRDNIEGTRIVLQRAGPGDVIAEASLFRDNYHCDGVVEQAASIAFYDRDQVLHLMQTNGLFAREMMAMMAGQLVTLRGRLELVGIKSARERIWQYLLLLMDGRRRIVFDIPYKQVASNIGLAHETFYRALAYFEEEGQIRRESNVIEII